MTSPLPSCEASSRRAAGVAAQLPDRGHPAQRAPELADFPRQNLAVGGARNDALQVADLAQVGLELGEQLFVVVQELHHVVARLQLLEVHHRHRQPLAEQAGAHRGAAAVDDIDQADPLPARVALEDLQVAEGELVHPHELLLVDAADRADVAQARMLRLLQVDQQRAGRADRERESLDGEALQALHLELLAEPLHGGVLHEGPFVEAGRIEIAEALLDGAQHLALDHQLLGLQGAEQRADVVDAALRHLESARGHVQEGGAAALALEGQAGEVVVFLLLEHPFAEGDARGEDLRDAALDELVLDERGILQLVADGHFVAAAHEFLEVAVDGVVREAGHRGVALLAVGAAREHESEHLADQHGVVGVGLIEV